ncbi:MAG TPA: lamin tail domain-containing protein [Polyangia bacterium]|nr:lamin tail domain-containing protein [Polyangia bacterium]
MISRLLRGFFVVVLGGLAASTLGCSPQGESSGGVDSIGDVNLALDVAPGVTLGSLTFTITGPTSRTGIIDTSHSATASTVVGGLAVGTGYSVALDGTATGGTHCSGSAPFAITAHATTAVSVHLLCVEPAHTGSAIINGTLNICAALDGISASPGESLVGGAIALSAIAHDADNGPSALTYHWTATGGTLSSATSASPTLTCTTGGAVTATVTVTDGDCGDTLSTTVTCTGTPKIVINEVESNGDAVGDWIELTNAGTATADISGYKLKDDTDSHAFVVVPSGTTLAPGGYYAIYVFATFGLGAPDMARLFDPAGNLIDSYSWTTHAVGTYGRCPNGTGPFVDGAPSMNAPNNCGGGSGGGGGAGGSGGSGGSGGLAANEFAWPGTDTVITVDDANTFGTNLSGLSYQPATATDPAVLWAIQNGPSKLYRLLWNGTTWSSDALDNWSAGKTIHYATGLGSPDSEGVSKAEFADAAIYVSTERDNDNSGVSRLSVLRFDTTAAGTDLTATNDWNLTADLPASGANLGLEAITYVPDAALVAGGFFDEAKGATYDPADYPNHGTGLFFVGLESNGSVYGYALNHADNTFVRVATFVSGQVSIMDLSYDREVGYLWGQCDNTCNNKATVFRLDTGASSPTNGHFTINRVFDRPASLPNSNFEGIGIAPEAECVGGQKHFFWSDDDQLDGHALRRGSIPCGQFF